MSGDSAAAIFIGVRSVRRGVADIDMECTRDDVPCPITVIIKRAEKYVAKIIDNTKYSQNQNERFMWPIISQFYVIKKGHR